MSNELRQGVSTCLLTYKMGSNIKTSGLAFSGDPYNASRNFYLILLNGIFVSVAFRFIDSNMVISAFVKQLTGSNIMVGVVSSTVSAGFMWPQLVMSNLLEHRQFKMPFYNFGSVIRVSAWAFITLSVFFIGSKNDLLLFSCFYAMYFIACSSIGVSSIPFNDIVAKAVPSERRARLFGLRQLIGEILGIGVGIVIKIILNEEFGVSFPHNYAILFGLGTVFMAATWASFAMVQEPLQPVINDKRKFREHLERGLSFLKNDRNYKHYILFRVSSAFGNMCIPFYVPFALDRLKMPHESIGLFTAVGAVTAVASNILWSYVGERHGSHRLIVYASLFSCVSPLIALSSVFMPTTLQPEYYLLVFLTNQVFTSGINIANITYTLDIAPIESRPTYIGFINTFVFPLSFVPIFAGFLLKFLPYELIFIFSMIISTLSVYIASKLTNGTHASQA